MRVLLAIDGSPSAAEAVELVAGVGWPDATSIRVIEVVPVGSGLFGGIWPALAVTDANALGDGLRAAARSTVGAAQTRLARPGLDVAGAVLSGRPATRIVQDADSASADLIVVGSRGHSALETMLLGSVSAEVIDHSSVPVLVVRRPRIERVVLAWDGSTCARAASGLLSAWPIFAGSAIRVVSVADLGPPWWTGFPAAGSPELMPEFLDAREATEREHQALASDISDELRAAGLAAEPELRTGDAAEQIVAAAREWVADLIVMGTHGRTGLERLLLGSVARNVLQHAPSSILIARDSACGREATDPALP
jgi:nucleotide-binding universal stress UspA family protein